MILITTRFPRQPPGALNGLSGRNLPLQPMTAEAHRRACPPRTNPDYAVLRYLHEAIRNCLARIPAPIETAVDLGCGSRPYDHLIRQVARRVIALDLDGNPLADLTYKAGEPVPLPDACADLVVSFQVLEHVPVPGDYLREAHRLLRAGGWLLLSTHGVWPYHPHPEDHHRWTHAGLTAEMERAGFVRSEVIPVLPGWAAALQLQLSILLYTWWPQRLYRWTGRILSWCFSWVIEVVERWPGPARELLASVYLVRAMRGEEGVGN